MPIFTTFTTFTSTYKAVFLVKVKKAQPSPVKVNLHYMKMIFDKEVGKI